MIFDANAKDLLVGVAGAGQMGRGIVQVAAVGGCRVKVCDVSHDAASKAVQFVGSMLLRAAEKGQMAATDAEAALKRIEIVPSIAYFNDCQVVIEAVSESLPVKHRLFTELEQVVGPDTVLASNTSSLSVTSIASVCKRPERVAGMHFFNPVPRMVLCEIVRALETDDATLATIVEVAYRMKKETVIVRESPGFVTSRLNALIGNEAFCMLQEGIASARDIDRAIQLGLNHPMGPFELVDLVGLDTRLAILEYLHKSLGEKYRPAPLLVQYVRAGRLGKKTGRGVYEYGTE